MGKPIFAVNTAAAKGVKRVPRDVAAALQHP